MAKCPACSAALPFGKVMLQTNFSAMTCKGCSKTLRPNKAKSASFGGAGAVIGYLLYVNLGVVAAMIGLAICFMVYPSFIKFEVIDPPRTES